MGRTAEITRVTKETDIRLKLNLDGSGSASVQTGIGFFDHMLNHTIEDTGIVLGTAIKEAVGNKKSLKRYGNMILPMDESLILCAIDLSGRPYFVFDAAFTAERVGQFETEMVKEFFYAVSYAAEMNLHIRKLSGENNHHIIEGIFKAFAKALDEASQTDPRITDVLSTKGTL